MMMMMMILVIWSICPWNIIHICVFLCYQIGHHLLVVIRVIDGIIFFCLSFGSPVFFSFFSSININCMIHFLLDTMTTNMNLKKQNKTQENRQLLGFFFFSVCICICIYVIVNLNRFWYCFIFLFFFFIMMMMMSFFSILIYIWIVGVYFFLAKTESKSWNWYDFFFVRSFVCLFRIVEKKFWIIHHQRIGTNYLFRKKK